MWLIKCLKPDHNTISNFRQGNQKAIKKVFRATVQIAKHFDLIGGKLIDFVELVNHSAVSSVAGDSTKLRAQNSKKNNYNQAKIERHIAYIDNKLEEYTRALAENDGDNQQIIQDEIKKQQLRKDNYRNIEKQLKESGEPQISVSDPESRQIMIRNNITEVAYNVQTIVDSCTRSKNGRILSRTKFAEYYERNRKNNKEKEHIYKRRQAIVEHPYGTIKRQWGFSYILTKKGISRSSSDVGFMFIAYNLRRIGNILTKDRLKEYLRILVSLFLSKLHLSGLTNSLWWTRIFHLLILDRKYCSSLIPV